MEEDSEDSSGSHLPPLKTSTPNSPSKNAGPISPADLKNRIMKLYPQIQRIEKDIIGLKQQIPSNLNQTILQIRQDTQRLLENENPTNEEGVAIALKDLEKRLKDKMDTALKDSTHEIELKVAEIARQQEDSSVDDETELLFTYRLNSIENIISQQQRRYQKRLSTLESSISKLSFSEKIDTNSDQLNKIKDAIDLNSDQLVAVKNKLNELQSIADRQAIQQEGIQKQIEEKQKRAGIVADDNEVINVSNGIPDLTKPLEKLTEDVNSFKREFEERTSEIDRKAAACEALAEELEKMSNELSESTADIEAHTVETEGLCKDLVESVARLNKQLNDDVNYRILQSLSLQIQSAHDTVRAEIAALAERMNSIELSLPLVTIKSNAPPLKKRKESGPAPNEENSNNDKPKLKDIIQNGVKLASDEVKSRAKASASPPPPSPSAEATDNDLDNSPNDDKGGKHHRHRSSKRENGGEGHRHHKRSK